MFKVTSKKFLFHIFHYFSPKISCSPLKLLSSTEKSMPGRILSQNYIMAHLQLVYLEINRNKNLMNQECYSTWLLSNRSSAWKDLYWCIFIQRNYHLTVQWTCTNGVSTLNLTPFVSTHPIYTTMKIHKKPGRWMQYKSVFYIKTDLSVNDNNKFVNNVFSIILQWSEIYTSTSKLVNRGSICIILMGLRPSSFWNLPITLTNVFLFFFPPKWGSWNHFLNRNKVASLRYFGVNMENWG